MAKLSSRGVRRTLSVLLLAMIGLLGCAQTEQPATQLVVTVSGDEDVMRQLRRIDAKLYASGAAEGATPISQHTFRLPTSAPISFGVARGEAERFLLVIEGYESDDSRVRPFIERKQRASFADQQSLQLEVYLARECFRLTSPCLGLRQTCRADARACVAVPEATTAPVIPGEERAAAAPVRAPVPEACAKSSCSKDYPCVPTLGAGYTCLGQFADWPMPDPTAGAANAPKYEASDALVKDLVTGLTWQRRPPDAYPGCSGVLESNPLPGSLCTLDEAKVYCHDLTLGGLSWRLPSKIELESLLDPTSTSFAISRELFPGCDANHWTGSPVLADSDDPSATYWIVSPRDGLSEYWDVGRASCVRCVSGSPTTPGTPETRYRSEIDGTILDTRTRLRWQLAISDPLETLDAAVAFCSAQGPGFRLPSMKELLTLVDPLRERPSIDPIFSGTPSGSLWATQGNVASTRVVWFALGATYVAGGRVSAATNAANPRARCVR